MDKQQGKNILNNIKSNTAPPETVALQQYEDPNKDEAEKNTFSNVTGYKINSKTSVAFLYKDDKWTEKEIRDTSHFTVATTT